MNEQHGLKNHLLYGVWCTMKNRCYNPFNDKYASYGKRGIRVCDEWNNSFKAFFDWAMLNGYEKGLSLDRDNNLDHYHPSNCRWVDQKTQQRNRRNNVYITAFGETKLRIEWLEDARCSVTQSTLMRRLKLGWTSEDAISRPLTTYN